MINRPVPYATIRRGGGALATFWAIWVFASQGDVPTTALGLVLFLAGWEIARRFARPIGRDSNYPPWIDTALPIAIAGLAILPAALAPFIGQVSIAVVIAIVVMFLAGMSISLGLGPYANQKVRLKTDWL